MGLYVSTAALHPPSRTFVTPPCRQQDTSNRIPLNRHISAAMRGARALEVVRERSGEREGQSPTRSPARDRSGVARSETQAQADSARKRLIRPPATHPLFLYVYSTTTGTQVLSLIMVDVCGQAGPLEGRQTGTGGTRGRENADARAGAGRGGQTGAGLEAHRGGNAGMVEEGKTGAVRLR